MADVGIIKRNLYPDILGVKYEAIGESKWRLTLVTMDNQSHEFDINGPTEDAALKRQINGGLVISAPTALHELKENT